MGVLPRLSRGTNHPGSGGSHSAAELGVAPSSRQVSRGASASCEALALRVPGLVALADGVSPHRHRDPQRARSEIFSPGDREIGSAGRRRRDGRAVGSEWRTVFGGCRSRQGVLGAAIGSKPSPVAPWVRERRTEHAAAVAAGAAHVRWGQATLPRCARSQLLARCKLLQWLCLPCGREHERRRATRHVLFGTAWSTTPSHLTERAWRHSDATELKRHKMEGCLHG